MTNETAAQALERLKRENEAYAELLRIIDSLAANARVVRASHSDPLAVRAHLDITDKLSAAADKLREGK